MIESPTKSQNSLPLINQSEEQRLKRFSFDSLKKNNSNSAHKVYIECHRGFHREETENTLAAFEKAILLGCDSIELDIWLTKDKIPIVIHGKDTGEINETLGLVNEYIYLEISLIKLENDSVIPRLEDVFKLCKNKIFLNLEMKDKNTKEAFIEVYKLIDLFGMHNEVAISSYHHDYHEEIKSNGLVSQIEFGYLYNPLEEEKVVLNFNKRNSTFNLWYKDINEEIVTKAHENNIGIMAWFCLIDEETEEIIYYLIKCKTDVICTNDPRQALKIRSLYYDSFKI